MSNPKFVHTPYLDVSPEFPQWYVLTKKATPLSATVIEAVTNSGKVTYYAAIVNEKIVLLQVVDKQASYGLPFVLDGHKRALRENMGGFEYCTYHEYFSLIRSPILTSLQAINNIQYWCQTVFPKSRPSEFYVGITNNQQRRWEEHGKPIAFGFILCASKEIAKEAEQMLIQDGFKGDTGGGEDDSVILYCFKK